MTTEKRNLETVRKMENVTIIEEEKNNIWDNKTRRYNKRENMIDKINNH